MSSTHLTGEENEARERKVTKVTQNPPVNVGDARQQVGSLGQKDILE